MVKSYFSKVAGFYRSSHQRCSIKKVFLERSSQDSQENTCIRDSYLIELQTWKAVKKRLWHKCFPVNLVKFLREPFFTEHLWTTASAFSFSEAATRGVLEKKVFLRISQNSQENTCGLQNFQEHLFYRTPLDDCF